MFILVEKNSFFKGSRKKFLFTWGHIFRGMNFIKSLVNEYPWGTL